MSGINGIDYLLESDCLFNPDVPVILGIDEAGRGPALGPMVYGAAFCAASDKTSLEKIGFKDSKQIDDSTREKLFETMRLGEALKIGWSIIVIAPEELSWKMLDLNRTNLNEISHNAAIELIRRCLSRGVNVTEGYVDTVGDPRKYQQKLQRIFPKIDIVVSKKADSLFPIVSAASIGAKVTRDRVLSSWSFKEQSSTQFSSDFGSGYPSDPKTKSWLQTNVDKVFGFPSVVRFSWKPCQKILGKSSVPVQWADGDDDEMEQEKDRTQTKLRFGAQRFRFFADNDMEICQDL